jgi:hypothetical protein
MHHQPYVNAVAGRSDHGRGAIPAWSSPA